MTTNINANTPERLRVFLCHASEDKPLVREIYARLRARGTEPWFDERELLPGHDWEFEITKAVRRAHVILVCLSRSSVTKEGYVQKELRLALEAADEKPQGTIYVIPVKLEPCEIPRRLRQWQWWEYSHDSDQEKLFDALQERASAVKAAPIRKLAVSTHRRSRLVEIQIRWVLWRTTDIGVDYLDPPIEGVSRHGIRQFHTYAIDNSRLCRGRLTLEIDWDEHGRQIAIGNQTVTIDGRWRDDIAIEVDEAAHVFDLFVKEERLVYSHLGLRKAASVRWASAPIGRELRIRELPELNVGIHLSDG